jgi:hypothetical protein
MSEVGLRYNWSKVQWIYSPEKPWTHDELLEFILRVEAIYHEEQKRNGKS